jgi:hypothetical protein
MPLERAEKFPEMKLPPVRLFQGDIQHLHDLLSPQVASIRYTVGDLIATSPSDLPALAEQLGQATVTRLTIDCKFKDYAYLTIDISWFGDIYGSAKQGVIGLAVQAHEMLRLRRRGWLSRFVTSQIWSGAAFSVVSTSLSWLAAPFLTAGMEPGWKKVVIEVATFVACYGLGTALYFHLHRPLVHLYPRSQYRSLFDWSDVKGWIGHIISALGGALALYAAQRLGFPLK